MSGDTDTSADEAVQVAADRLTGLGVAVQRDVALGPMTTYRVGGPTALFVAVSDRHQLPALAEAGESHPFNGSFTRFSASNLAWVTRFVLRGTEREVEGNLVDARKLLIHNQAFLRKPKALDHFQSTARWQRPRFTGLW